MMKCQPHLLALFAVGILGCPSDDDDPPADTNGSTSSASSSSGGGMQNDTTDGGDTSTGTPQSDSSTDGGGSSTAAASTGTDESAGSSSDGGSSSGGSDESTGTTGAQGALPDLDMSIVGPDTQASISIQFQNFSENDCEVVEACVPAAGMRRLLRFSTITPNVGDADFHVGSPMSNPELFTFSACQGTDLFTDYAAYRLLDDEGNEVGTGHKSAFALIDLVPWAKDAGPAQYGFGAEMGISVGWSDVYDAGLPCQWVDITDVPAGDYTLELDINGDEVVLESDFTNNILQLPVTIPEG